MNGFNVISKGPWKPAAAAAVTILLACVTSVTPLHTEERTHKNVKATTTNALYDQCTTEDSDFTLGSCMLSQECDNHGGTVSGSCAEGLGACCIVKMSCNSETGLNNTYFVNPDSSSPGACALTINRANDDICQVRLDFIELQLSQPDTDGHCTSDFLAVTGEMATKVPTICGTNDGQHMYVDVVPDGGSLELIVDSGIGSEEKTWKIQVQQIACDSRYRAPEGCLQYHTHTAGTAKSFNFSPDPLIVVTETRQIANLNYGVCIKKAPGYCGIIWERDIGTTYSFTVSNSVGATLPDLLGTPAACSTGADNCMNDYVIISGGVDDMEVQADRYCGLGFPNFVTSTIEPFVLYVKTDSNETPDEGNLGFQLNYRQTTSC